MKTLNTRWGLLALVPLVAIAILLIGNRPAVPGQTREVREAANEVGIVVQGGITHGQVLRFNVARLANHPGGVNLELRVFDSHGNVLASNTYVFPNGNPNGDGNGIKSSFFDLSADQLPQQLFDNTGRAHVTGIVRAVPGPHVRPVPPTCGFVASGEIFNFGDGNGRTVIHIAGAPIGECRSGNGGGEG